MKRRWLLISLFAITLLLLSIPRFVLIPRLVRELETDLQRSLHSREVDVQIRAPWGWELFLGRIPGLTISAKEASVEGLQISRAELVGEEIRFDAGSMWRERELVLTDVSNLTGGIYITEEALNELFWEEVDPERHLSMVVSPQGLGLQGTLALWGMEWTVTLLGDLEVLDGSSLRFVVKNLEVQETRIPSVLLEVLTDNYSFDIDFGVFPYPVEVTGIELLEQQILVEIGGLQ